MSTLDSCQSLPDKLSDREHHALNARLGMSVVVLYALQQTTEAPIAVGLYSGDSCLREAFHAPLLHFALKMLGEEHSEKGRH